MVRPSAASDREPAERRGYGDPLSSSSGRGSRAPWRDGASWAGRSASSGLSWDPLHPASGTVAPSSPRGTRTRRRPTRRMARRRPADDMAAPEGVSNAATGDGPSAPRRVARGPSGPADAVHGYSQGVCAELPCDAVRGGAILSGPSAPGRSRETSGDLERRPRGPRRPARRMGVFATLADPALPTPRPWPTATYRPPPSSGSHRTNGREAGLASRPGRAPGLAVPGQLRDLAARHRSSSTSTTSASGSRSPTASPRTGWRPATGR